MIRTYTNNTFGGFSTAEEKERKNIEMGDKYQFRKTNDIQFTLGIWLTHDYEKGIVNVFIKAYLEWAVDKFSLQDLKSKPTPLPPSIALSRTQSPLLEANKEFMKGKPYVKLLGTLQFAQAACHPHIAYSTNLLSCFMSSPGPPHWNALIYLARYLNGTKMYAITYKDDFPGGENPITYSEEYKILFPCEAHWHSISLPMQLSGEWETWHIIHFIGI